MSIKVKFWEKLAIEILKLLSEVYYENSRS